MTFELPDGPHPELSTTRVAGGASARVVAAAVAAMLIGVVGFAVVNRPPAPAPVAVAPTSPATSLDNASQATPDSRTAVFQVVPDGATPVYDGYGVELVIAGGRYPGQLFGDATDHLSTAFSVPAALASGQATLHLAKVNSSYSHDIVTPIGDWQVPLGDLDAIRGDESMSTLLDESVEGEPSRLGAPSLVQGGYEITVRASATVNSAHLLAIDVLVHPAVRNQIKGDDGLAGGLVLVPGRPERRIYRYTASMQITGGLLRIALERQLEDVYSGSVVIASSDVGPSLALELGRRWSDGGLQIFESFDAWDVPLKPLRRSAGGLVELLITHVPPGLAPLDGLGPTASGYTFTVLGRREGGFMTLHFELVWPVSARAAP